jgi:hypothetical protein
MVRLKLSNANCSGSIAESGADGRAGDILASAPLGRRACGIDSVDRLDDQPTLVDVDFDPLADRQTSA